MASADTKQAPKDSLTRSHITSNPVTLLSPVSLRTLTGGCHNTLNRRAIAWGSGSGLVAHGCGTLVVVIDPVTLQAAQVLDRHRSAVVRLAWCAVPTPRHPADRLTLASADATGHIVVWNVKSGEVKSVLQENGGSSGKAVAEMRWMDGQQEGCGHLLAALHPPFAFVLWDTSTGEKIWKKTYAETLQGFDFDPFDASRVAFRCIECVLFIDDFSPTRAPTSSGRKFYVLGPARGSPARGAGGGLEAGTPSVATATTPGADGRVASTPMREAAEEKSRAARTKIKRMMKELVLGESPSGGHGGGDTLTLSECLQVLHHRTARNHLMLVYPKEILILDLDIGQTVGVIQLDRGSPPILQAAPSCHRDAIFVLNESGTVSLRARKRLYHVAATPIEPIRNLSKSISTSSITTVGSVDEGFLGSVDNVLEIVYEQRAYSESVRLSKNAKILGMAMDPMSERNLAVLTSDGKVIFLELVDFLEDKRKKCSPPAFALDDLLPSSLDIADPTSVQLRLLTSGILSGLALPPFVIRMCPPLTMKNLAEYVPLMAVGASNGNIQIANMSTGKLEREFAVHTFPVRGIEWTGLTSLLSHAHQNLSGSASALVRNELLHTDIRTGKSTSLRSHRAEEPPIDMLRVSHLKQYFIVAFTGAPFELWDLKNLTLLRTMPKKFPPITALDWSPLHNLKSLKKKMSALEESNKENKDQKQDSGGEKEEKIDATSSVAPAPQSLVAKEHFVFTDPEGQLYHFSVEGNAIRDGTKVPAESSLGSITCIAWKSDHIVRGDSDGHLNVWDVRTRTSRNISTHRGAVRKMRFAPGRGNLKLLVLNPDSVAIWDVKECEMINELRVPKDLLSRVVDVDWAASDRAVLATMDGCLRIMGLSLASSTSALYDYSTDEPMRCHPLLANKARQNFHILLHHQPWKEEEGGGYSLKLKAKEDGFSASEMEFVQSQIDLIPSNYRSFLESASTSSIHRCLIASQICGQPWESQFWRVAAAVMLEDRALDTSLDVCCGDSDAYIRYHNERVKLHETRCASHAQRRKVIDQMLCLGQKDEAVRLLLETEPDNPCYYEDNLRACLVASTAVSEKDTPHSTTKLVATNLIAEGKVWEGVQLLCMINKVPDACKYLQSCGQWDASLWLARCRLSQEEFASVAEKYCDHTMAKDLKKRAVLVRLSLKDYVGTLDALLAAKMVPLAAQFLGACSDRKLLPAHTSHMMCLREEISLAFARQLFDCGNSRAAFYFCDRADEKGEMLRREMEMLMAKPEEQQEKE